MQRASAAPKTANEHVIVIQDGAAGAHRFGQILAAFGAVIMFELDTRLLRHVAERYAQRRRLCRRMHSRRRAAACNWDQYYRHTEEGEEAPRDYPAPAVETAGWYAKPACAGSGHRIFMHGCDRR